MYNFKHALFGATAALALSVASAQAETVLNFSEPGPNRADYSKIIQWMADELEERSGGEIKMNINWSGALLSGKDTLGGVQDGVADIGTAIAQYTPKDAYPSLFPELPLVKPDPWIGSMAIAETFDQVPELTGFFENNLGVVVLAGNYINPSYIACSGEPITDLESLQGRKIRGSGSMGKVLQAAGAETVNLSLFDTHQALSSGLVDCTQSYAGPNRSLKFYEVADTLTRMDMGQAAAFYIVMNADLFHGLPEDQQALLKQLGKEVNARGGLLTIKSNQEALDQMQAGIDGNKVTLHTFDAEDQKQLQKHADVLGEEWVAGVDAMGLPGQKILDTYLAAYAKYEKQLAENGYPEIGL